MIKMSEFHEIVVMGIAKKFKIGGHEDVKIGERYGSWEVIRELELYRTKCRKKPRGYKRCFECRCDCGELRRVFAGSLRRGVSSKCIKCRSTEKAVKQGFDIRLEAFGKIQSWGDWQRETGIHRKTVKGRIDRGWSTEDALSKPVNKKMRNTRAKYVWGIG